MGFCLDLFTIMIGVGAILYILLGLFSLFGFEVLETHAKKWGNNSVFTKPTTRLAVVFLVPGLIYTCLLSFLVYYSYMKKSKVPNSIPYLLNPAQSKQGGSPMEMTKHSEEELISTDSNKGNANPVDEVTDQRVGSINI